MAIRLYDSAWVQVEGKGEAVQVFKDRNNPAAFNIDGHLYDIDGRPFAGHQTAPAIVRLHSLQSAKDVGLAPSYRGDPGTAF